MKPMPFPSGGTRRALWGAWIGLCAVLPPRLLAAPNAEIEPAVAASRLLEGAGASLVPLSNTRVRRALQEVHLVRQGDSWRAECLDVFVGGPIPETVQIGLPEFEAAEDSLAPAP